MAGETALQLDKPRTLKFGIRDVREFEQNLGYGVDELQARGQRMTALVALLFYGLRHEDKALTLPLVERKLQRYLDQGGDIIAIVDATYAALYHSGVYGTRLAEVSRRIEAELGGENGHHQQVTRTDEEDDGDPSSSAGSSSTDGGAA